MSRQGCHRDPILGNLTTNSMRDLSNSISLLSALFIKQGGQMSQDKQMAIERLRDIQGEIDGLVNEADRLIHEEGSEMAYSRAKSYWLAHILGALTGRGSMVTAEDTIKEMEEEVESERQ